MQGGKAVLYFNWSASLKLRQSGMRLILKKNDMRNVMRSGLHSDSLLENSSKISVLKE